MCMQANNLRESLLKVILVHMQSHNRLAILTREVSLPYLQNLTSCTCFNQFQAPLNEAHFHLSIRCYNVMIDELSL